MQNGYTCDALLMLIFIVSVYITLCTSKHGSDSGEHHNVDEDDKDVNWLFSIGQRGEQFGPSAGLPPDFPAAGDSFLRLLQFSASPPTSPSFPSFPHVLPSPFPPGAFALPALLLVRRRRRRRPARRRQPVSADTQARARRRVALGRPCPTCGVPSDLS